MWVVIVECGIFRQPQAFLDHVTNFVGALIWRVDGCVDGVADALRFSPCGLGLELSIADDIFHNLTHIFSGVGGLPDFADLILQRRQHSADSIRDFLSGFVCILVTIQHRFVSTVDIVNDMNCLADDTIQVIDKAIDPAVYVAGLVSAESGGV